MKINYSNNQETCFKYIFFQVALVFKFLTLAFEALQNLAPRELYAVLSVVSGSLPALKPKWTMCHFSASPEFSQCHVLDQVVPMNGVSSSSGSMLTPLFWEAFTATQVGPFTFWMPLDTVLYLSYWLAYFPYYVLAIFMYFLSPSLTES